MQRTKLNAPPSNYRSLKNQNDSVTFFKEDDKKNNQTTVSDDDQEDKKVDLNPKGKAKPFRRWTV